ncbi:Sterol O-acyltransferase 2 (Sterol-ester synthase 2) [Coemansia sp. RSA 2711]|nr:Sterol O-acyltransferase 2 (Sterol-ester synthase 2) [Coemansia sp. RSA 2711]KAJ2311828.1 Sterol O-acyltransferase 2 (Sterol-ester synthase 2) [Coemansia sp. RSA 2705]
MFVPQVADGPPSSHDSPRLRPQMTRREIEAALASGSPPPVFTPSLRRSLRKDRQDPESDSDQQLLHPRQRKPAGVQSLPASTPEAEKHKGQLFFRPRTSILDYTELMYQGSDRIRGLVTCFWTVIGAYLISLLLSHYESNGEFLASGLASLIFSRATDLVLSDLALVLSTAFVVPFVRVLWIGRWQPRWLDPRHPRSMLFQAAAEIGWLVVWYTWQGTRGWPWSQRCFFSLHTAVNWMKVHSYLSTNRRLACSLRTRDELKERQGSCKEEDETIQTQIRDLDAELCPYSARFPETQTLANYAMFQLCPALVYEIEYPRTSRIRWGYVAEKTAGTAGIFIVFYIVVAHLMIPHLERMHEVGLLLTTVHLMGPMATCWLLFFFITFDSIANGFAELTCFADRRFYDDWWNARGLDDFSRKWNRPVHMFLARHIYMPVRELWKGRRDAAGRGLFRRMQKSMPPSVAAMAATFFFSSILHEVTIVVACHRWNHGLFFFSQMMQIPLILFTERAAWFREQQALRNWSFWLAMVFFQPFLLCMYTYGAFVPKTSDVIDPSGM